MTNRDWQAYVSMDALRHAHDYLFDELPKLSSADREKSGEQIEEFVNRAISTGRILDTISDRREAQGLIDYWISSAYTKPRNRGITQADLQASSENQPAAASQSAMPDAPTDGRSDNQLQRFDQTVIDSVADKGDEFVLKLSNKERELTRQILFRMIHFPDTGDNFVSAPASLDELRKFGDPGRVDRLLEGLKTAGVISVKSTEEGGKGEVATLHYLALTRRWKWLDEEVKKRMNFRDLALSWVGSGRSTGALLDWSLTRGFRKYSNLSEWETEFVNKSGRVGLLKLAAVAAGAVVLLVGSLNFRGLYATYYAPGRVLSVTRETLDDEARPERQVENIKWLADNRQKIELPGLVLKSKEPLDLRWLFASGAIFKSSKLSGIRFDHAALAGASFSGSVIENASFAQAYLYRAGLDGVDLCANVDFTDADVLNASFKRARFFDDRVPIFVRAAWWQADGWGFDEIAVLDKLYPKDKIQETERFQRERTRAQARADAEKDPFARADALNVLGWTLAIFGVVSDGNAEAAARDALTSLDLWKKSEVQPDENRYLRHLAEFRDTLAYILMQDTNPEKHDKNLEEAVKILTDSAKLLREGDLFRYAVVLHAANRDVEARKVLEDALLQQQYSPSHELYLLGPYITGELKKWIMDMTGRPPNRLLPTRCLSATK
jgi:hypothetical protein